MPPRRKAAKNETQSKSYDHPSAKSPLRPDVGAQVEFSQANKPRAPRTYRYDSSLAPSLEWDGQNAGREEGEALLAEIAAQTARLKDATADQARQAAIAAIESTTQKLRALGRPFLNWAGKAERLSFDVPTLPLFVHERLSTKAIIETLKGHKRDKQLTIFDLFGDPQHSIADQVLRAYEHMDEWKNRMILGDNLPVMNSLLHYENLGGQVQMIYMDPPYGVSFGSNFQPFIRKREVKHNDDAELTREPEMVKAYRDTWELGLHSYLTFLRDCFLLCRELLHPTGSFFLQISTENINKAGQLLAEVFGEENLVEVISFRKKTMPLGGNLLEGNCDYLLWYAKDKSQVKYHSLFQPTKIEGDWHWNHVELPNGKRRPMTGVEIDNHKLLPAGADVYRLVSMYPAGSFATGIFDYTFDGVTYRLPPGKSWKTPIEGMDRLARAKRLQPYLEGKTLRGRLEINIL